MASAFALANLVPEYCTNSVSGSKVFLIAGPSKPEPGAGRGSPRRIEVTREASHAFDVGPEALWREIVEGRVFDHAATMRGNLDTHKFPINSSVGAIGQGIRPRGPETIRDRASRARFAGRPPFPIVWRLRDTLSRSPLSVAATRAASDRRRAFRRPPCSYASRSTRRWRREPPCGSSAPA
jgi:hypothetical protein